ncbi:MAG: septum formation initiator family protein [Lachnospiraceae bacterium]|nr:septum formation initiator family protein [Lachnospiraceae bacterium]
MAVKKKKQLSVGNRLGMYLITVIVMVMLVGLLVQSQSLRVQNAEYEEQKAELEQELQDEEVRAEDIDDLAGYLSSDEYIEKLAREKLGLVYEDDVIYRAAE